MKKYHIGVLITLLLLGCNDEQIPKQSIANTSDNATTSVKHEKIKLRWMAQWYGEGDKERMVREIAREFSLLNQDIDLQLDFPDLVFKHQKVTELPTLLGDSIAKMIVANDYTWDIFACDQWKYKVVAESLKNVTWGKEYLVDFSEYDWFKAAHKEGVFTPELKNDYGGIVPGTVIEGITQILFVSQTVEQTLGIKVKRTDMNFSDLLEYAKAVSKYNQEHEQKITFLSTQYLSVSLLATQLLMSAYGKLESPTKAEALDAFSKLYQAFEQLAPYNPIEQYTKFPNLTWNDNQRMLVVDKFLFNMQPSWINQYWKQSNPNDVNMMKPCEIPSMDNSISKSYPGFFQPVFVVAKNAKNKEAAERLMKFIASKDIGEKWVNYSKCPTGIKIKMESSDFGQTDYDIFFRHIQDKYGKNQKDINLSQFFFGVTKSLNFNFENVLMGAKQAKDALKELENQLR